MAVAMAAFNKGCCHRNSNPERNIAASIKQSVVEFGVRHNLKKFMIHNPKYIPISGTLVEH
jgi:hypothetical protein